MVYSCLLKHYKIQAFVNCKGNVSSGLNISSTCDLQNAGSSYFEIEVITFLAHSFDSNAQNVTWKKIQSTLNLAKSFAVVFHTCMNPVSNYQINESTSFRFWPDLIGLDCYRALNWPLAFYRFWKLKANVSFSITPKEPHVLLNTKFNKLFNRWESIQI